MNLTLRSYFKFSISFFSALFSIALACCSCQTQKSVYVDFSKKDFEQVALQSKDYVDNWVKVKLETTSDCLLAPHYQIYPCNDFIIAYGDNRILQFAYSGEFMKTIVMPGNGPNETNNLIECIVNGAGTKLYWTEFNPNYIHTFDLVNGEPATDIPIYARKTLKAIRLINDTTLLCFPYMGNTPQTCYRQNPDGDLLEQSSVIFQEAEGPYIANPLNIFSFKDEWFYRGHYEDTVYNALSKSAFGVFKRGGIDTKNPIGQNQVLLSGIFYTDDNYILSRTQYDIRAVDESVYEMYIVERRYFLFDYSGLRAFEIESFSFAPLDRQYEQEDMVSFLDKISSLNREKIVVNFPAEDFGHSPYENPVLFIGDIKTIAK